MTTPVFHTEHSVKPTGRAIALLTAGILVALLPVFGPGAAWPATFLFWAGAAIVLGADAVLSPGWRRVRWGLITPPVLHVGAREPVALELTVPSFYATPVEAVLGLSDDLAPLAAARGTAGRGPTRLEWTVTPSRRGMGRVEHVWIRYRSPLRLWWWWIVAPVDRALPVRPDVPRVKAAAIRFFADREFRSGLKVERYVGDGSEFESLREYFPGDDDRTIDWKATARHRRLLCRQHRAERNHQVVLVLDTGRLMSELFAETSRLDHALNGALLLAYVCLKTGDQVGLFTFDARPGIAVGPVRGMAGMAELIHAADRIAYSRDETNFTLGLTTLSQRLRRRSLVMLLTDFSDTVTAELMLDHLRRMVRRHVLVFVSLRDPGLTALASGTPADVDSLGRAVVARDLLRDRDRVHRSLQRLGVPALDVPPARIGPELINKYLEIKRRERI